MKFDLDTQQRDFAASIDAALSVADVPAAARAWAAGNHGPGLAVWSTLAELGVTALAVSEKYDGIGAHPVDLVVALEGLGKWAVPGPVVESVAVAPVLLSSHEDGAEPSTRLASGELIATVAAPPIAPAPSTPTSPGSYSSPTTSASAKRRPARSTNRLTRAAVSSTSNRRPPVSHSTPVAPSTLVCLPFRRS